MTKFLLDLMFQMGVILYVVCSFVVVLTAVGMLICILGYLWEKKILGKVFAVLLMWVLLALFALALGGIQV